MQYVYISGRLNALSVIIMYIHALYSNVGSVYSRLGTEASMHTKKGILSAYHRRCKEKVKFILCFKALTPWTLGVTVSFAKVNALV